MLLCGYDCIVSCHLHVPVFLVYFDKHKSKIVNNYYGMYLPAFIFLRTASLTATLLLRQFLMTLQ